MGKKSRGKKTPKPKRVPFVARPFEGMAMEVGLIAMREILPAATAPVTTTSAYGSAELTLVTLLPNMTAAMRRENGDLLVAVQTVTNSGDASRDLAALIIDALELEPGEAMASAPLPEPGPRLDDVLVDAELDITLYDDFAYWVDEEERQREDIQQAVEQTRSQVVPSAKVEGITGAYWCRMSREFVRWIRTEDEDAVLDALARLSAARTLSFEEGAEFKGAFRAQGLMIPVWELPAGAEADELTEPMAAFEPVFEKALAATEALTPEERRARSGIVSRQLTLR